MSTKKHTPQSEHDVDIDALLRQSAQQQNTPRELHHEPPEDDHPATTDSDLLARLNARITHAQRDLRVTADTQHQFSDTLDQDIAEFVDLEADLERWEDSMNNLESALARVAHCAADATTEATPQTATDNTVSRSMELLEQLTQQEQRIRELEARLAAVAGERAELEPTRNHLVNEAFSEPGVNRLVITINAEINQKFPLYQNIMTIGRDPQNDIQIRSRYISRFHARIVSDREGCVIEDMDSQNGVCVNSARVRRRQLSSGDLIDLGRVQLKFIDLMEGSSDEGQA